MGSKSTLYYSDEMHLYKECFNDNAIYLKLNKNNLKIEIEFSLLDFLKLANSTDLTSLEKQANLSDEQIIEYCKKRVDYRKTQDNEIMAIYGYMVFGDKNLPTEEQVKKASDYYINKRNDLKKIYDELKKINFPKNFFGLEHILNPEEASVI